MELPDLLKVAVERKASDLHVKVGSPPILRIDDKLVPLVEMPRLGQDAVVTMAASVMNASTPRTPKAGTTPNVCRSFPASSAAR